MSEALEGKVAIVTGGGRGLGAAICEVLTDEGVTVVVADRDYQSAQVVAMCLWGRNENTWDCPLDVQDAMVVQACVAHIHARLHRIDILVNNAGVNVTADMDTLSVEEWDRILNTNLRGAFLMSKAVWPIMRAQKSGHIINIVSTASKRIISNAPAYNASKWGLAGLTQAMHVEGRQYGIKVTALNPGGMRTKLVLDRFPDLDPQKLQDPMNIAKAVPFILSMPPEAVVADMLITSMNEPSWP